MLFYLFIFCLTLGQLQRISLFGGSVNFYFHEIVMVLFITLFFRKKGIVKDKLFVPTSIFILTLFVSLVNNSWNFSVGQNLVGLLYILRLCLYFLFFFSLKPLAKPTLEKGLEFYTWMIIDLSIIQYFLFPKLNGFVSLGFDPHEFRMVGTFFDVSLAGIIYIFLLFFVTLRSFEETKFGRRVRFIQSCIFLAFILFTFSRITYIAFFGSVTYLLFYKAPIKNFILIVLLFLSLISILPHQTSGESNRLQRTFSIHSRIEDIQQGLKLWQNNPVLGVGYNRIQFVKGRSNSRLPDHSASGFSSTFVTILAGAGIIGLIGFFVLILSLYRNLSLRGRLFLIPLLITATFDNVFTNALVLPIFLILISFVGD